MRFQKTNLRIVFCFMYIGLQNVKNTGNPAEDINKASTLWINSKNAGTKQNYAN